MNKFLIHIIDPLFLNKNALFCCFDKESFSISERFPNNVDGFCVITHDVNLLLTYMRQNSISLNNNFIDISDVYQLIVGRPSKYFNNFKPWSFWKLVLGDGVRDSVEYLYEVTNNYKKSELFNDNELKRHLRILSFEFLQLWEDSIVRLKRANEYDRYFEIELPIGDIFHKRHYDGLTVSQPKVQDYLDLIDRDIARASNVLRKKWKILDPSRDDCVLSAISNCDDCEFLKQIGKRSLNSILDMEIEFDEVTHFLGSYRKSVRDKDVLLRLGYSESSKIYPDYHCIGTVTGRILVKNPSVQNLSKRYRDIFVSDVGCVLVYPDYSAFEPGILANESGDCELIQLYNDSDIYSAFSNSIFGSTNHRAAAKKIFLAYMFGMDIDKLAFIASKYVNNDINSIENGLCSFLKRFNTMHNYIQSVNDELRSQGRIGTKFGNYRYLAKGERDNWSLSQRIQGTASYILKKAILSLASINSQIQFLLPMHDAILLQIPERECEKTQALILNIMKDTFKEVCPKITPRIKLEYWGSH